MRPRFPLSQIPVLAARYQYPRLETALMSLRPLVLQACRLTKPQLRRVARWKSPRSAGHVEENSPDFVREITGFALSTSNERARIEALTLLDGVLWPSASVILHLYHREPYPIIDFRALWSLSAEVPPQYSFAFWSEYVRVCRSLAQRAGVPMRTLDRALWQFSKENQPSVAA